MPKHRHPNTAQKGQGMKLVLMVTMISSGAVLAAALVGAALWGVVNLYTDDQEDPADNLEPAPLNEQ